MNADRWREVEQIFHAALKCDGDERALFLDRACDGHPSLRNEVDALIASHERAGSFLKAPRNAEDEKVPWQSGESSEASDTTDEGRFPSGTILAQRYRIVTLLGRGGMGEVGHDYGQGANPLIAILQGDFLRESWQ